MQLKPTVLQRDFYVKLFLIGIATFAIHEFFHWIAGVALDYEMIITPNRVFATSPTSFVDAQIIAFAGPLITYVQALVGYLLVVNRQSLLGYALLYMAFFMRFLAALASLVKPNDEARISQDLGMGLWTLPTLVVAILFVLVYITSRRLKLTVRDQIFCYLIAAIVITLVVGVDAFFFKNT